MPANDFVIFGECLVELSWDREGRVQQGFAGDVYSVAVYLKRRNPGARVRLLCAIGQDPLSEALATALEAEGVDTSLLLRHPARHTGLYAIHTDDRGERSFSYWRSESAARLTLTLLAEHGADLLADPPDYFYLSGISLAVAEAETPGQVEPLIARLRAAQCTIIFDTNYRPALWSDAGAAQKAFGRVLQSSDMVLPGVEDLQMLYGIADATAIGRFLAGRGVETMVLKNGPADILFGAPGSPARCRVKPVKNVIDTTAAGDSFAGTLLGALSTGLSLDEAVSQAAKVSARVIQHRGAILPPQA